LAVHEKLILTKIHYPTTTKKNLKPQKTHQDVKWEKSNGIVES
jgi:hypothetical protein